MTTWFEFRAADGRQHPDAAILEKSPLALLIQECLRKHEDVFGDPIDVYLSDDGTLGELHLSPSCLGKWVPVTVVPVNISMFRESLLSENLRASVLQFFTDFSEKQRKK